MEQALSFLLYALGTYALCFVGVAVLATILFAVQFWRFFRALRGDE